MIKLCTYGIYFYKSKENEWKRPDRTIDYFSCNMQFPAVNCVLESLFGNFEGTCCFRQFSGKL